VKNPKLPLIGLILVAVLGVWLGNDLTGKHFTAVYDKEEATIEASEGGVCEGGDKISCLAVNGSKYSSIPLGEGRAELPVAVPAIGFFALVAFLAILGLTGTEERRRKAVAITFALGAVGLLFGIWLIYVQAVLIEMWCPFCLGIDACSLAVVVLSLLAHGGGMSGIIADAKQPELGVGALALLVMLAVDGGAYGSYNGKVKEAGGLEKRTLAGGSDSSGSGSGSSSSGGHSADDGHGHGDSENKPFEDLSPEEKEAALVEMRAGIGEFLAAHAQQPRVELTVNPFDGIKGNPEAKVTMIEWADFDCPHCKQAAFFMQDIAQRYYDHVQFVFRHYPLGHPCNDQVSRNVHPNSCEAAWANQCARREGQFWPFHDHTFDNQGSLGTRKMLRIAETVGIDRAWMEECINRNDVRDEVTTQIAQGREAGVRGTPTMFLNGRELLSIHPLAVEAAIRFELQEAGVDVSTIALPPGFETVFPQ